LGEGEICLLYTFIAYPIHLYKKNRANKKILGTQSDPQTNICFTWWESATVAQSTKLNLIDGATTLAPTYYT